MLTMKYILYARKSSESEDRQVLSVDSQIQELKALAKRNGQQIVAVLQESMSAKDPEKRPVFEEMVDRIKGGEAQGIICWKLDRLARNPVDGGTIQWMLQRGDVTHIQTADRSYYPSDNVLLMSVELGMANQFIRDLSQNTKRGLRAKAAQGHYPGYSTIGYMHDPLVPKGKKYIIPDPERFSIVQRMLRLIIDGEANPPQALKVATEEWGLRSRLGNKLPQSTIYRIIKDPFYAGYYEYPKASGNWFDGLHEAMITRSEYDTLQAIMKRPSRTRPKTLIFAYTGLIYCGECGGMVTAEIKRKVLKNGEIRIYIYYHCTKRKNPNCTQKCITEEELESQLVAILKRVELPEDFSEWVIKQLELMNRQSAENRQAILRDLQANYQNCTKRIDTLIDMRTSEAITSEEFDTKKVQLLAEKERIHELLNDKDRDVNQTVVRTETIIRLAEQATLKLKTGSILEKKRLVSQLCSNLTLLDNKLTLEVEKPFSIAERLATEVHAIAEGLEPQKDRSQSDLIAEKLVDSDNWLPRLDSNQRPIA